MAGTLRSRLFRPTKTPELSTATKLDKMTKTQWRQSRLMVVVEEEVVVPVVEQELVQALLQL